MYCIAQNISGLFGGNAPKSRFFEIMAETEQEPEETDGNKIAADVIKRCGLEVITR